MMQLKVLTPTSVVVDEPAQKLVAVAENGSFGMLPDHIDFLSSLVPGLFAFTAESGEEVFLAVDEGLLVKRGSDVLVSVRRALRGGELESLRETVDAEFRKLNERQRVARSAVAKLESDFMRRLLEVGESGP